MRAQTGGKSGVFKIAVAEVVIERRSVAGEVRLYDIQIAVQIVIRRRYSHARLRLAVGAQRATGFHGDVHKLPVFLVLVESTGGGIVGDVDVGPAVIVEIRSQDSQPEGSIGLQNARGLGDVGECAVSIVVIKDVLSALEAGWPTSHHHTLVQARP